MLRRLELDDMDATARVVRAAFDHALPSLADLHTPKQNQWFFRERVFETCEVWGAFDSAGMTGMIAFRKDWIDKLCVLPDARRRGIGTELLPNRVLRHSGPLRNTQIISMLHLTATSMLHSSSAGTTTE